MALVAGRDPTARRWRWQIMEMSRLPYKLAAIVSRARSRFEQSQARWQGECAGALPAIACQRSGDEV
jgi:hypothetical protein